jgi:hypothetical protein
VEGNVVSKYAERVEREIRVEEINEDLIIIKQKIKRAEDPAAIQALVKLEILLKRLKRAIKKGSNESIEQSREPIEVHAITT